MRRFSVILLFLSSAVMINAQAEKVFSSPELGLAFNATGSWKQVEAEGNRYLKLVNCNNNLEVDMWVDTETQVRNLKKYLSKLASAEGLTFENGPFNISVAGEEGAAVIASTCEMRKPVRMMIVAFEKDNILHMVRFKCPDECYEQHKGKMQQLIGAVSVLPKEESFHFYASLRLKS